MPDPNEVGAGWKKQSANGVKYLSLSLDLDKFHEVSGGQSNGRVNFVLFARKGEKTKESQPDYNLIFSAPSKSSAMRREQGAKQPQPPDDDGVPF